MNREPTPEEMGRAVLDGQAVKHKRPVMVRMPDGYAVQNLADDTDDPWVTVTRVGRLTMLDSMGSIAQCWATEDGRRSVDISAVDRHAVRDALHLGAEAEKHRHTATGDELARKAGMAAMRISNAHVRLEVLRLVGGLEVCIGALIDGEPNTVEGAIYTFAKGLRVKSCLLLQVKCPSTARIYHILVPGAMKSAKEARLWAMNLPRKPGTET